MAQDITIDSINKGGSLSFSGARIGTTATVEWAASLTGAVGTNWYRLRDVAVTGNTMSSDIPMTSDSPMFFRVRGMPATNIMSGLVAYYPFNGSAKDESGNGNHGGVSGATVATDRFGRSQQAYAFDGSNDFISVPYSSSYRPSGKLTIAVWMRVTSTTGYRVPLSCTENGGWNLNFGAAGNTTMNFGLYAGGTAVTPGFGSSLLSGGAWHHIVGTFDGSVAKIYLDGASRTSLPISGSINYVHNNALIIGGEASAGSGPAAIGFFAGTIDEVRIYNRDLSASEVLQLYQMPY
jgi:hypothetical protein